MTIRWARMASVLAAAMFCGFALADTEPSAEDIARQIVRNQISPETMDEVYVQAAQAASTRFQLAIQPAIKRAVTEDEKQRLFLFWHDKIKELISYPAIEDLLAPIVTKNLSLDDLQEIRHFTESPVGRRYAKVQSVITRESRAAGEQLGKQLADKDWQAKVVEELKRVFPQWFPASPPSE